MYEKAFHKEPLNDKNFLITGGAGFIGSNLVEYLMKHKAGKVRVLDNLSTGNYDNISEFESNTSFEFIKGDITNYQDCEKACKGIDIILHQAALGSVPRSIENPIATNAANITGFVNMLVACKEAGVKRFVYAASSSTYGDSKKLPKVEDEIGLPLSPYAVTKYTNELYAKVFGEIYNMEIIGLRYFNIFGPKQNPDGPYAAVIPCFARDIINDIPVTIHGDGEQTRDFTFIKNAVQANIKAGLVDNSVAINQVYNIAAGDRTSINQIFESLKQKSGKNIEAKHTPSRAGDVRDSLADISKAQKLLGYNPDVKVPEGLEITFDWFQKTIS